MDTRLQSRILLACLWITPAGAIVLLTIPWHQLRIFKLLKQLSDFSLTRIGYQEVQTHVAMSHVIDDNDTRGPMNAIRRQNAIFGNIADGVAEHFPNLRHAIKNSLNEFFATRDKDPSFKGKQCLTNEKNKSIHSDISHTIKEYCDYVGNVCVC
jgi:hypothetical protein